MNSLPGPLSYPLHYLSLSLLLLRLPSLASGQLLIGSGHNCTDAGFGLVRPSNASYTPVWTDKVLLDPRLVARSSPTSAVYYDHRLRAVFNASGAFAPPGTPATATRLFALPGGADGLAVDESRAAVYVSLNGSVSVWKGGKRSPFCSLPSYDSDGAPRMAVDEGSGALYASYFAPSAPQSRRVLVVRCEGGGAPCSTLHDSSAVATGEVAGGVTLCLDASAAAGALLWCSPATPSGVDYAEYRAAVWQSRLDGSTPVPLNLTLDLAGTTAGVGILDGGGLVAYATSMPGYYQVIVSGPPPPASADRYATSELGEDQRAQAVAFSRAGAVVVPVRGDMTVPNSPGYLLLATHGISATRHALRDVVALPPVAGVLSGGALWTDGAVVSAVALQVADPFEPAAAGPRPDEIRPLVFDARHKDDAATTAALSPGPGGGASVLFFATRARPDDPYRTMHQYLQGVNQTAPVVPPPSVWLNSSSDLHPAAGAPPQLVTAADGTAHVYYLSARGNVMRARVDPSTGEAAPGSHEVCAPAWCCGDYKTGEAPSPWTAFWLSPDGATLRGVVVPDFQPWNGLSPKAARVAVEAPANCTGAARQVNDVSARFYSQYGFYFAAELTAPDPRNASAYFSARPTVDNGELRPALFRATVLARPAVAFSTALAVEPVALAAGGGAVFVAGDRGEVFACKAGGAADAVGPCGTVALGDAVRTGAAAASPAALYYFDAALGVIARRVRGSRPAVVARVLDPAAALLGSGPMPAAMVPCVCADEDAGYVYWTQWTRYNASASGLYRAPLSGGAPERVLGAGEGAPIVTAGAVAVTDAGTVLFGSLEYESVMGSTVGRVDVLDRATLRPLANATSPHGMPVAFWLDSGPSPLAVVREQSFNTFPHDRLVACANANCTAGALQRVLLDAGAGGGPCLAGVWPGDDGRAYTVSTPREAGPQGQCGGPSAIVSAPLPSSLRSAPARTEATLATSGAVASAVWSARTGKVLVSDAGGVASFAFNASAGAGGGSVARTDVVAAFRTTALAANGTHLVAMGEQGVSGSGAGPAGVRAVRFGALAQDFPPVSGWPLASGLVPPGPARSLSLMNGGRGPGVAWFDAAQQSVRAAAPGTAGPLSPAVVRPPLVSVKDGPSVLAYDRARRQAVFVDDGAGGVVSRLELGAPTMQSFGVDAAFGATALSVDQSAHALFFAPPGGGVRSVQLPADPATPPPGAARTVVPAGALPAPVDALAVDSKTVYIAAGGRLFQAPGAGGHPTEVTAVPASVHVTFVSSYRT